MWNKLLVLCIFGLAAATAQAQVALIFERENIRIESPTQVNAAGDVAVTAHPPLTFDMEVRGEDALRLEYIHTLNALGDNNGVVISLGVPSIVSLPALRVPTAVDTLFVAQNGSIVQILPSTVLADLTQEIVAPTPIKAFVFLKAGTVKARDIRPRDMVRGSPFAAPPGVVK